MKRIYVLLFPVAGNPVKKRLLLALVISAGFASHLPAQTPQEGVGITITVNGVELQGSLNRSTTSAAFLEKLPLTLPMLNRYSRELVYRFADPFPAEDVEYTGYEVGEIIYWPPRHSFVIMYAQNGERFSMQKMGTVLSDLDFLKDLVDPEVTIRLSE